MREVWRNEAKRLTAWLPHSSNMAVLAETLGLSELVSAESGGTLLTAATRHAESPTVPMLPKRAKLLRARESQLLCSHAGDTPPIAC
jgi:hypothetical protein